MSVTYVQVSTTGLVPNTTGGGIGMTQQSPTVVYITTNDVLATVLTTGYLNTSRQDFNIAYNNYQMALVYATDVGSTWLRVSVSGTNYSLVTPTEGSGSFSTILLGNGSAAAPSVAFTSDVGTGFYRSSSHVLGFAANGAQAATLSATAFTMLGNIVAGASGTAGTIKSFPSAVTSGSLALVGVANSADVVVSISNTSFAQASTVSFTDVGSAAGRFLVANTATPFVSGNFPKASGTGGLMVDSGIAATSLATYTGATVSGNVADFNNTTGQLIDSGVALAALQLKANIKAAQVASLGGGGAGPLTVTAAGCTTSSIVNVTILASSNAAAVEKVVPGTGNFALTLTADPGATLTIQYVMFIAAQ